jgi:hypothetical protein
MLIESCLQAVEDTAVEEDIKVVVGIKAVEDTAVVRATVGIKVGIMPICLTYFIHVRPDEGGGGGGYAQGGYGGGY